MQIQLLQYITVRSFLGHGLVVYWLDDSKFHTQSSTQTDVNIDKRHKGYSNTLARCQCGTLSHTEYRISRVIFFICCKSFSFHLCNRCQKRECVARMRCSMFTEQKLKRRERKGEEAKVYSEVDGVFFLFLFRCIVYLSDEECASERCLRADCENFCTPM